MIAEVAMKFAEVAMMIAGVARTTITIIIVVTNGFCLCCGCIHTMQDFVKNKNHLIHRSVYFIYR